MDFMSDRLADGRRFRVFIATQTLQRNKPGELFEVRYAIPFALIQNKTDAFGQKIERVTVKFQAYQGSIAGGVLGIRIEKRPDNSTSQR